MKRKPKRTAHMINAWLERWKKQDLQHASLYTKETINVATTKLSSDDFLIAAMCCPEMCCDYEQRSVDDWVLDQRANDINGIMRALALLGLATDELKSEFGWKLTKKGLSMCMPDQECSYLDDVLDDCADLVIKFIGDVATSKDPHQVYVRDRLLRIFHILGLIGTDEMDDDAMYACPRLYQLLGQEILRRG